MTAIPDSIKERIEKLSRMAADKSSENEATIAMKKLQALLAAYTLEMSQIAALGGDESPDATREKISSLLDATEAWQDELLGAIAANNFCMGWRDYDRTRIYHLIGRSVNVLATKQMYLYLTRTVDRLCPFVDKRTREYRSWRKGCSDRLRQRLDEQRWESELASRAKRDEAQRNGAPSSSGTDLVLADVYSTEDDLNRDYLYELPVGTTAARRRESRARWEAEQAERRNAPVLATVETLAEFKERQACEEKEAKENARWYAKYKRQQEREAAKIDQHAYAMGSEAGSSVSLNRQIEEKKQTLLA